jgi:hypothetical protein
MLIKSSLSAAALIAAVTVSSLASPAFRRNPRHPRPPSFVMKAILQVGCGNILLQVPESRRRDSTIPISNHHDTRERAHA